MEQFSSSHQQKFTDCSRLNFIIVTTDQSSQRMWTSEKRSPCRSSNGGAKSNLESSRRSKKKFRDFARRKKRIKKKKETRTSIRYTRVYTAFAVLVRSPEFVFIDVTRVCLCYTPWTDHAIANGRIAMPFSIVTLTFLISSRNRSPRGVCCTRENGLFEFAAELANAGGERGDIRRRERCSMHGCITRFSIGLGRTAVMLIPIERMHSRCSAECDKYKYGRLRVEGKRGTIVYCTYVAALE